MRHKKRDWVECDSRFHPVSVSTLVTMYGAASAADQEGQKMASKTVIGVASALALGLTAGVGVSAPLFAQAAQAPEGQSMDAATLAAAVQAAIDSLGPDATEEQVEAAINAVVAQSGADASTIAVAMSTVAANNATNPVVVTAAVNVATNPTGNTNNGGGATGGSGGGTGGGAPTPPPAAPGGGGGNSDY